MKLKRPTVPLLFMKPTTAVIGPDEPIGFSRSTKRRLRRWFVADTDRRSRGGRLDKNRRSGT